MQRLRTTALGATAVGLTWVASMLAPTTAAEPPSQAPAAPPPIVRADDSAMRLFAAVEEAWLASDADRLAGLVDTTVVRIAVKPGAPPTAAVTRTAASFLFQDQLRLVKTRSFRVVKLEVSKKGKARGLAEWSADWGGRQGARDVTVVLAAAATGGRWSLTEVRAND